MPQKKVYVMMSGGVDSSVASLLLTQEGYEVIGVYMKCWSQETHQKFQLSKELYACNWEDDVRDAQYVAKKLGIKFEVWELQTEYSEAVVEYMISEYRLGRTPNPDVMCNSEIKFGVFYKQAMKLGADFVATGHYARILDNKDWQQKVIASGLDPNKDQTYFLWKIKKSQIPKILFPVGEITSKSEVRKIAAKNNLLTANKKDSQGLCFLGKTSLRDMLLEIIGNKPGWIVTEKTPINFRLSLAAKQKLNSASQKPYSSIQKQKGGETYLFKNSKAQDSEYKIVGTHPGSYLYTIGQRQNLNLSHGPWLVKKIDIPNNLVIVTHRDQSLELQKNSLLISDWNWQVEEEILWELNQKNGLQAQIRYRGQKVSCQLSKVSDEQNQNLIQVFFESPVNSPSIGQSLVFYFEDVMLGGAIIHKV